MSIVVKKPLIISRGQFTCGLSTYTPTNIEVSFLGYDYNNGQDDGYSQSSYTFSNFNIGTPAANKYLIIGVGIRNDTRVVDSVTVGGNSATEIIEQQDGNATCALYIIDHISGNSVEDIVVTLNGVNDSYSIGVWSVTNLQSTTPDDSIGVGTSGVAASGTLTAVDGGIFIGFMTSAANASGANGPATASGDMIIAFDLYPESTDLATTGGIASVSGTSVSGGIDINDGNSNAPAVFVTMH